ncbi:MAG: bifunctional precorrin-2 dehydrogenase/sirohydrochlorin ferrochelatase [bacterium]
MKTIRYFPVFLDLRNRKVLLVGNGPETEKKLLQVLESGARIYVVCPQPLPVIVDLAEQGKIAFRQGEFKKADLNGVWLVIGTSQDQELNERIAEAAKKRRIFHNIVDVTHLCDFIVPAIVSRGDIKIAISTSGKSPALAQRLKSEIAALVGPEYGELANLLGESRRKILQAIPSFNERKKLFHQLVESDLLELFQRGEISKAKRLADEMIDEVMNNSIG